MTEENGEKKPYGFCENCAEPFDKPYTHCPFCGAVNKRLDQQLQDTKSRTEELLRKQMQANREWAAANRKEVNDMVDAQHEANLKEMKSKLTPSFGSSAKSAGAATGKGGSGVLKIIGAIVLLVVVVAVLALIMK